MFHKAEIMKLLDSERDALCLSSDQKYALYRYIRDDKYEFRMEYVSEVLSNKRVLRQGKIDMVDTMVRFYLPLESTKDEVYSILNTILRNCLLIEREVQNA